MAINLTTEYQKLGEVVIGNAGYGNFLLRLYGRYTEQSTSGNTTTVQYQLRHYVPNGAGTITYYSSSQTFTGDVSTSTTNSKNKAFSVGETTLLTATKTITHTANGTKSISVGGSFTNSYFGNTVTISGVTCTLPSIARASKLDLIYAFTFGEPVTIPITKYSSSFTDTLTISLNETTIKTINDIKDGDTVNFTTSELNKIYGLLPNVTSGYMVFTLTTKSGNTTIGTCWIQVRGIIPSDITPSASLTVSENVSEVADKVGVYLVGKSQLNIDTSGSVAGTGASIASYKISANGETFTSSSAITSVLKSSGTQMVSVTVTDSRGRTSTKGLTIGVRDYFAPQAGGLNVYRCNSDGTLNDDGTYLKAILNYNIAPIENLNLKNVSVQYLNGETWTNLTTLTSSYSGTNQEYISTQTFDVNNSYQIKLLVEDHFSSDEIIVVLPTAFTLINFHSSGTGIGIGKVAENENELDVALKFHTRNGIKNTQNNITTSIDSYDGIHSHFQTNSENGFRFNKNVYVDGDIYGGDNHDKRVAYYEELLPVVLFSGDTYGNVTLTDNLENYEHYEIIFTYGGAQHSTGKLSTKNGNPYLVAHANVYKNSLYYLKTVNELLTISEKTFTRHEAYVSEVQINGQVAIGSTASGSNLVHIIKVLGYKY